MASDNSILFYFAGDGEIGSLDAYLGYVASPTSNDLSEATTGNSSVDDRSPGNSASFLNTGNPDWGGRIYQEEAHAHDAGDDEEAGVHTMEHFTVEREQMATTLMTVTGIQDVDFTREFLQDYDGQLEIGVNAYVSMGRFSTGDSRHLPLFTHKVL